MSLGHPDDDRVATDDVRGPVECPSDLGQVPPKGSKRIVGVMEEQFGNGVTRWGPLAQHQIGQKRPRLTPARRPNDLTVALDERLADKTQHNAHGTSVSC